MKRVMFEIEVGFTAARAIAIQEDLLGIRFGVATSRFLAEKVRL